MLIEEVHDFVSNNSLEYFTDNRQEGYGSIVLRIRFGLLLVYRGDSCMFPEFRPLCFLETLVKDCREWSSKIFCTVF